MNERIIMNKNKILTLIYIMIICAADFTAKAFANAFDQNNMGMRGGAMASAFTGVSDDPTAIYYNPGGMTDIKGGTVNYEADLIIIFSEFLWEDTEGKEHKSDLMNYIPGLYLTSSSGDLSYGIGFYAPYGGGSIEYDTGFEATIAYLAATPSVAYKIIPSLSIGAGVSLYYGIFNMTTPPTADIPVDVELTSRGICGWGWNLGLLYKPTDELNLGLSVRSRVPIKMEGTAEAAGEEMDTEVEFTFPYYFIAGMAYKITPDFLIDIDFWYMQWKKMDKITLTIEDVPVMGDTKQEIKTYYGNSYDIMIGFEYLPSTQLRINAGFKYEKQVASKDEGVSIMLNCETDRYTIVAGIGYYIMDNLEISMNLSNVIGVENEVDLGGDTDGTYSQYHKSITLGIRGYF